MSSKLETNYFSSVGCRKSKNIGKQWVSPSTRDYCIGMQTNKIIAWYHVLLFMQLMDALQSTMQTWIGNISLEPLNIPVSMLC